MFARLKKCNLLIFFLHLWNYSYRYCYCFDPKYYKYYEGNARGVTSQSDLSKAPWNQKMLQALDADVSGSRVPHAACVKPGGLCTVCFCLRSEGKVESWTDARSQRAVFRGRADNVLLSALVQYSDTFFQFLPLTQTSTIGYFFLKVSFQQMEKSLELCGFCVDFLPLSYFYVSYFWLT